jgi:hypothetical protein
LLGIAIAACGAAWADARYDLFRRDELAWHLGESPTPIAIRGRIEQAFRELPAGGDPRRAAAIGPSSECVVSVEAHRDGSRWRPASGRATVIVDGSPPPLGVGDRVRILGRGLRPSAALESKVIGRCTPGLRRVSKPLSASCQPTVNAGSWNTSTCRMGETVWVLVMASRFKTMPASSLRVSSPGPPSIRPPAANC